MRILYHFPPSPFSRRVRLALALKGLDVTLRDARESPEFRSEAGRHSALKTIPILVDGESAIGDSTAITHYLDRVYADSSPLWPADPKDAALVFDVAALADAALDAIIEVGNRYYALRNDEAWLAIRTEMVNRAQRALDALGDRAKNLGRPTVAHSGWSAADIWLFTTTNWFEAMPERAKTLAIPAQIMSLGWTLPPELSRWADQHRNRSDVLAL